MEPKNIKIFQKNIGEFYIATVVDESPSQYICKDYFMIQTNVEKNPDGEGFRMTIKMLPDDLMDHKAAIFFRTFCPGLPDIPITISKSEGLRVVHDVPETLKGSYEFWINRVEANTKTNAVTVPVSDADKTVKLFSEDAPDE